MIVSKINQTYHSRTGCIGVEPCVILMAWQQLMYIVFTQGYQGMVDGGELIELAEWKTVSNILHKVQCSVFTHTTVWQTFCRWTLTTQLVALWLSSSTFSETELLEIIVMEVLEIMVQMSTVWMLLSHTAHCQSVEVNSMFYTAEWTFSSMA